MYQEQVIWISARAISFTAVCDHCLSEKQTAEAYLGPGVSGSLRIEARHGWCTCRRGHDIRVERVNHALAGVIP